MPRFVVLEHDWPTRHWDFLLEAGDVLRAWRILGEPRPGATLPAEANFDHRKFYLEYEGPVSGGRGRVMRWDAGTFEWIETGDRIEVRLNGTKLRGGAVIAGEMIAFAQGESPPSATGE
jgi:hypothetical protein